MTKSKFELENEETERLSRPDPKIKPPRYDKRRNLVETERDEDLVINDAEKDPDLSLNYKKIASDYLEHLERSAGKRRENPNRKPILPQVQQPAQPVQPNPSAAPNPVSNPVQQQTTPNKSGHKPGDVWKSSKSDKWRGWKPGTNKAQSFDTEQEARAYVSVPKDESETPENKEQQPPQVEAPQVDAPQVEAPQVDAPQVEAPQVEAPQVDAPQVEAPQVEAPQVEAPQVEAPQVEAPQVEAPQVDVAPISPESLELDDSHFEFDDTSKKDRDPALLDTAEVRILDLLAQNPAMEAMRASINDALAKLSQPDVDVEKGLEDLHVSLSNRISDPDLLSKIDDIFGSLDDEADEESSVSKDDRGPELDEDVHLDLGDLDEDDEVFFPEDVDPFDLTVDAPEDQLKADLKDKLKSTFDDLKIQFPFSEISKNTIDKAINSLNDPDANIKNILDQISSDAKLEIGYDPDASLYLDGKLKNIKNEIADDEDVYELTDDDLEIDPSLTIKDDYLDLINSLFLPEDPEFDNNIKDMDPLELTELAKTISPYDKVLDELDSSYDPESLPLEDFELSDIESFLPEEEDKRFDFRDGDQKKADNMKAFMLNIELIHTIRNFRHLYNIDDMLDIYAQSVRENPEMSIQDKNKLLFEIMSKSVPNKAPKPVENENVRDISLDETVDVRPSKRQEDLKTPPIPPSQEDLELSQEDELSKPEVEVESPESEVEDELSKPEVDVESPEPEIPDVSIPELDLPKSEPDLDENVKLDTPNLDTPELDTPDLEVPDFKVPDLEVPDLDTPELDIPSLDTPKLDEPTSESDLDENNAPKDVSPDSVESVEELEDFLDSEVLPSIEDPELDARLENLMSGIDDEEEKEDFVRDEGKREQFNEELDNILDDAKDAPPSVDLDTSSDDDEDDDEPVQEDPLDQDLKDSPDKNVPLDENTKRFNEISDKVDSLLSQFDEQFGKSYDPKGKLPNKDKLSDALKISNNPDALEDIFDAIQNSDDIKRVSDFSAYDKDELDQHWKDYQKLITDNNLKVETTDEMGLGFYLGLLQADPKLVYDILKNVERDKAKQPEPPVQPANVMPDSVKNALKDLSNNNKETEKIIAPILSNPPSSGEDLKAKADQIKTDLNTKVQDGSIPKEDADKASTALDRLVDEVKKEEEARTKEKESVKDLPLNEDGELKINDLPEDDEGGDVDTSQEDSTDADYLQQIVENRDSFKFQEHPVSRLFDPKKDYDHIKSIKTADDFLSSGSISAIKSKLKVMRNEEMADYGALLDSHYQTPPKYSYKRQYAEMSQALSRADRMGGAAMQAAHEFSAELMALDLFLENSYSPIKSLLGSNPFKDTATTPKVESYHLEDKSKILNDFVNKVEEINKNTNLSKEQKNRLIAESKKAMLFQVAYDLKNKIGDPYMENVYEALLKQTDPSIASLTSTIEGLKRRYAPPSSSGGSAKSTAVKSKHQSKAIGEIYQVGDLWYIKTGPDVSRPFQQLAQAEKFKETRFKPSQAFTTLDSFLYPPREGYFQKLSNLDVAAFENDFKSKTDGVHEFLDTKTGSQYLYQKVGDKVRINAFRPGTYQPGEAYNEDLFSVGSLGQAVQPTPNANNVKSKGVVKNISTEKNDFMTKFGNRSGVDGKTKLPQIIKDSFKNRLDLNDGSLESSLELFYGEAAAKEVVNNFKNELEQKAKDKGITPSPSTPLAFELYLGDIPLKGIWNGDADGKVIPVDFPGLKGSPTKLTDPIAVRSMLFDLVNSDQIKPPTGKSADALETFLSNRRDDILSNVDSMSFMAQIIKAYEQVHNQVVSKNTKPDAANAMMLAALEQAFPSNNPPSNNPPSNNPPSNNPPSNNPPSNSPPSNSPPSNSPPSNQEGNPVIDVKNHKGVQKFLNEVQDPDAERDIEKALSQIKQNTSSAEIAQILNQLSDKLDIGFGNKTVSVFNLIKSIKKDFNIGDAGRKDTGRDHYQPENLPKAQEALIASGKLTKGNHPSIDPMLLAATEMGLTFEGPEDYGLFKSDKKFLDRANQFNLASNLLNHLPKNPTDQDKENFIKNNKGLASKYKLKTVQDIDKAIQAGVYNPPQKVNTPEDNKSPEDINTSEKDITPENHPEQRLGSFINEEAKSIGSNIPEVENDPYVKEFYKDNPNAPKLKDALNESIKNIQNGVKDGNAPISDAVREIADKFSYREDQFEFLEQQLYEKVIDINRRTQRTKPKYEGDISMEYLPSGVEDELKNIPEYKEFIKNDPSLKPVLDEHISTLVNTKGRIGDQVVQAFKRSKKREDKYPVHEKVKEHLDRYKPTISKLYGLSRSVYRLSEDVKKQRDQIKLEQEEKAKREEEQRSQQNVEQDTSTVNEALNEAPPLDDIKDDELDSLNEPNQENPLRTSPSNTSSSDKRVNPVINMESHKGIQKFLNELKDPEAVDVLKGTLSQIKEDTPSAEVSQILNKLQDDLHDIFGFDHGYESSSINNLMGSLRKDFNISDAGRKDPSVILHHPVDLPKAQKDLIASGKLTKGNHPSIDPALLTATEMGLTFESPEDYKRLRSDRNFRDRSNQFYLASVFLNNLPKNPTDQDKENFLRNNKELVPKYGIKTIQDIDKIIQDGVYNPPQKVNTNDEVEKGSLTSDEPTETNVLEDDLSNMPEPPTQAEIVDAETPVSDAEVGHAIPVGDDGTHVVKTSPTTMRITPPEVNPSSALSNEPKTEPKQETPLKSFTGVNATPVNESMIEKKPAFYGAIKSYLADALGYSSDLLDKTNSENIVKLFDNIPDREALSLPKGGYLIKDGNSLRGPFKNYDEVKPYLNQKSIATDDVEAEQPSLDRGAALDQLYDDILDLAPDGYGLDDEDDPDTLRSYAEDIWDNHIPDGKVLSKGSEYYIKRSGYADGPYETEDDALDNFYGNMSKKDRAFWSKAKKSPETIYKTPSNKYYFVGEDSEEGLPMGPYKDEKSALKDLKKMYQTKGQAWRTKDGKWRAWSKDSDAPQEFEGREDAQNHLKPSKRASEIEIVPLMFFL
jgi:hypothetical protein